MILTASHRRTVSRLGMLTITLFAFLTVPAWSVGQGLGSTGDETPPTEEEVTIDATDDGTDVELEVEAVEKVVALSDDESTAPVIVNVEEVVEIPVLTIDGGQDEISVPVRVKNVPLDAFGQPFVVQVDPAGVGEAPRRIGVLESAGDDVLGRPGGAPILVADDQDVYRSGADRRIQRIEKNIQKLERSLEAVLSELRSLRRDRRSSSDAFGGSGLGGSGLGGVNEPAGRRRTSTSRRFTESADSILGTPNTPRQPGARRRSSGSFGESSPRVRRSATTAPSDAGASGSSSSRRRRSTKRTQVSAADPSPGVRSSRTVRSSRNSTASTTVDNPFPGAGAVGSSTLR